MRKRLSLFGLHALFWLAFFIVCRILFLFYHYGQTTTLSWKDIFTILFLGMRMDAAMAAYCIILTGFILSATAIRNYKFLAIANHVIVGVFLFNSCLIVVTDLELYRHWGFRMDTTPLQYAGSEGVGSVNGSVLIGLIALVGALFGIFFFFYLKKIAPLFSSLPAIRPSRALAILSVTGLLFFPIRSSITVSPLNTGVVYFHKTIAFANHAGINVVWYFFEALTNNHKVAYPEDFYDQDQAVRLLGEMTSTGDRQKVLRLEKPNILLIILESFTSKVIEPLGGKPGITPALNGLIKEGILFDNFYSSGDRTDKGIVSILSAYPAQPRTSIIVYPNKTEHLPFLSKSLQGMGYHTSFVYGGDIAFANMESYVTTAGFGHITEDDDFDSDLINSKWGVHDHQVFKRLLSECDTASGPFFKVMLSLSSHEPFDVPLDPPFIKGRDEASLFLNACYYADQSLGEFIRQAKTKAWWSNLLVVITADHGHRFPDPEELNNKDRFKIPMLWLGGALARTDTVIHTFGGHPDIVNTILGQVGEPDRNFKFSKDLMGSNTKSFAVYIFNNGYGFVHPEGENTFDFYANDYVRKEGQKELVFGKAYMQMLFTDYNDR